MEATNLGLLLIGLVGGLAFFLYGMKVMDEGLQALAGGRMRELLYSVTRNRLLGFGVGSLGGLAIHSGPTTVLLVSFINAGMISLLQSVPVILGANFGTTLSMQLISFKIGVYAPAVVALGVLLRLSSRRGALQATGLIVLGFGLLFLGMDGMAAAVTPLRDSETIRGWLAATDGSTPLGFTVAVLSSVVITALLQSSGATIGIIFALCHAGLFTSLVQVFPFILGAHIGTCSATLLGALGSSVEARRSALAHLLFNVLGTLVAAGMVSFYLWALPLTSSSLVRQVANGHTLVQLINALLFLPFVRPFTRLVVLVSPSKQGPVEQSYLDDKDLATPEKAICNAMRETQRMAALARRMLVRAMSGLLRLSSDPLARVAVEEDTVNTLKRAVNRYLMALAGQQLSGRQSIMLQHLMVANVALERIADHAQSLANFTEIKVKERIWFDDESMRLLVEQYVRSDRLLRMVIISLDPDIRAFKKVSTIILNMRREIVSASKRMRKRHRDHILAREITPLAGIYYERYLATLDRIVRQTKAIARAEQDSQFLVKPERLETRTSPLETRYEEGVPLPFDESILNLEMHTDDLGIDEEQLKREVEEEEDHRDPSTDTILLEPAKASSGRR